MICRSSDRSAGSTTGSPRSTGSEEESSSASGTSDSSSSSSTSGGTTDGSHIAAEHGVSAPLARAGELVRVSWEGLSTLDEGSPRARSFNSPVITSKESPLLGYRRGLPVGQVGSLRHRCARRLTATAFRYSGKARKGGPPVSFRPAAAFHAFAIDSCDSWVPPSVGCSFGVDAQVNRVS